jgi:hypothetical protein
MSDSSSEDEEDARRARHGSDHLRGVPVLVRHRRGLRLERPGRARRIREAGEPARPLLPARPGARPLLHSSGAALGIRDEATKKPER